MTSFKDLAKKKQLDLSKQTNFDHKQTILAEIASGEAAKRFVQDVCNYGTSDSGDPLQISEWFKESLRLIGDLRVHEVYVSGSAQIGKSTASYLFAVWLLVEARFRVLWAYSNESVLLRLKPQQFDNYYLNWLKRKNEERDRRDIFNTKVTQHNGGLINTVFVNKPNGGEGAAAAGSNIVSVTADIAFLEERSQYQPGAADPVPQRLNFSIIPSKPIREIGTKGSGNGIESSIKEANYYFLPYAMCTCCEKLVPLHAFGCLIKSVNGDNDPLTGQFLDADNKIVDWFNRDSKDAVNTAYFACPYCEAEITDRQRTEAFFVDHYSKIRLSEFLDKLDPTNQTGRIKVAIDLTPLLRITAYNLASDLINTGLTTTNIADYLQQSLSVAFESVSRRITIESIQESIGRSLPKRERSVMVAGLDQGRGSHFLSIAKVSFNECDDPVTSLASTTLRVLFCEPVHKNKILGHLADHKVKVFAFDCDPQRDWAKDMTVLASAYNPIMVQNKPKQNEVFKEIKIADAGDFYTAYGLRVSYFLNQTLIAFESGTVSTPLEWSNYLSLSKKLANPPYQFLDLRYEEGNGAWIRSSRKNDDLHFATAYCYVAFYYYLLNNLTDASWYQYIS